MQGFCPLLFPVNGFIDSLSAEYQFGSIAKVTEIACAHEFGYSAAF